jgi:DNA-binding CsgD family transcriptional regulator
LFRIFVIVLGMLPVVLTGAVLFFAIAAMAELPLSPREKKLLRRLAKGMSVASIAVSIGGRADQVHDQRARLLAKLGINSEKELIDAAARLAPLKARATLIK